MEFLYPSQSAAPTTFDEDDFSDEMTIPGDEPVPSIILQKKGTTETVTLAISEVETWDDLLKALREHFSYSDAEPQITSFDGNLIASAESYKEKFKPGLHLIVYFPPTINEVSQSLDSLFTNGISPTIPTPELSPQGSRLADYLNPPPTLELRGKPRRYHLQPPTIYFNVPTPTPINVCLSNSAFKNIPYYSSREGEHPKDPIALYAGNSVTQYSHHTISPDLTGAAPEFEGPTMGHTIMGEIADLPTRPRGAMGLPPWSQFPVYSRGGDGKLRTSTYRIVSGGYFPMTSFDPLARDQRKRAMCSIGWDVIALPGGGLEDIVSGRIISSISWVAKAGYGDQRGYIRTSETRMYGNPEGLANPENDSQRAGWWMVEPGKLPTGFVGDAGEHTFLLHSVAEMVAHLNAFMKRCGIVENVIEVFTKYWARDLKLDKPTAHGEPRDDGFGNELPEYNLDGISPDTPKLILLKFLHPRDLRNLLPLSVIPAPHRTVRLFAVFRVVEQWEINAEGIDAYGDFEMEVSRVVGDVAGCGGGFDCGHSGIKVAEVGGVRVFGDQDE